MPSPPLPTPAEGPNDRPAWLLWALIGCFAVGMLRVLPVLLHDPLIALANSYDEVRYSACFDLYPDRPEEINPTLNSPAAPYAAPLAGFSMQTQRPIF